MHTSYNSYKKQSQEKTNVKHAGLKSGEKSWGQTPKDNCGVRPHGDTEISEGPDPSWEISVF
jgi:hypothetical protein